MNEQINKTNPKINKKHSRPKILIAGGIIAIVLTGITWNNFLKIKEYKAIDSEKNGHTSVTLDEQPFPTRSLPKVGEDARALNNSDINDDPRALRQKGEFSKALQILESLQSSAPTAERAGEILSIIEDTGNSLILIERARQYREQYPEDHQIKWLLTKGLLFAAATFQYDNEHTDDIQPWLSEAEELIKQLEKSEQFPPEVPGYIPILKAELAFLRQDWEQASINCREGLRLGTTAGETGDLYSMLFDIACRQGKREEANDNLDKALQVVANASANSYYGLRMFREEALIVKDFILDRPFTEDDLNNLWKIHTDLLKAGFVDPTSPDDSEAENLHKSLHTYLQRYAAQDYASCLQIIDSFIENKPNHTPRCFFSEAVMSPLRPLYLNMVAGKLCIKMGNKSKAKQYFQTALKAHPGDKLVLEQLQKIEF